MKVDLKITGGTILDPERGVNALGDLLIRGSEIVAAAPGEAAEAQTTIHAEGCLVLPGLIDFTRIFTRAAPNPASARTAPCFPWA